MSGSSGGVNSRSMTPAAQRRASVDDGRAESTGTSGRGFGEQSPATYTPVKRTSSSPFVVPFSSERPVPGLEKELLNAVPESQWVPDDMATGCCLCHQEFNLIRRRHHCRTCGRLVCDDCSNHKVKGDRICASCWDRLGRKMSGIGLGAAAASTPKTARGVRRSALKELLEEERYNREFVMADGRKVGYSVAGVPDGLPVFLFLGLDSHRHSAAHFEDPARRRGLRLICIDRPGRGRSDPIAMVEADGKSGSGSGGGLCRGEDAEIAVVETVKQMCAKLRLDKAAVMGQSLGAVFALRCARDPELKVTFEDTTVCLVSPWVPLVATGSSEALVGMSKATFVQEALDPSSVTAMIAIRAFSEMALWKNSNGSSDIESGYLEAPYTQELIQHVTEIKEGKDSITHEVAIALRNTLLEDELVRGAEVLHPVHIWHGRNDKLVPYPAAKWLQGILPQCEMTVKIGGTHALMYDKGEMEAVFAALHKGISEAKSKARFTARRLTNSLSYVASDVMAMASASPSASTPLTAATSAAALSSNAPVGAVSPRTGRKPSKDALSSKGRAEGPEEDDGDDRASTASADSHSVSLRDKIVSAISTAIDNQSDNGDAVGAGGGGSAHGSLTGSAHGSITNGSGHGSGSAHGSGSGSGHGNYFPTLSLMGPPLRRGSGPGSAGGSRHSAVGIGSLHGSAIPENGEMAWGSGHPPTGGDGDGGSNLLGDLGKQINRALSGASMGGNGGSSSHGAPPSPAVATATVDSCTHDHGEGGGKEGVDKEPEGFLDHVGRMMTTMALTGGDSGHGSVRGGSGGGSGHGSTVASAAAGNTAASTPGRPSGLVLPWSHHSSDGHQGGDGAGEMGRENDGADNGSMLGEVKRALSSIGAMPAAPSPATVNESRSVFSYGSSHHDTAALGASFHSVGDRRAAAAAAAGVTLVAGYEAARANWPAGKVEGEPAWEVWSDKKKLVAHLITASCLALIVATF